VFAYLSVFYPVIVLLVAVAAGRRGHIAAVETAERTPEWGADGRRVQFETKVCANKHYIYCVKWAIEEGHL